MAACRSYGGLSLLVMSMPENFTTYEWEVSYRTSESGNDGKATDILHDFYIPALKRSVRYDRVAGYFRSSSLAAASQGYTAFLQNDGHMRLIVGADLQLQDVAAILGGNRQRLSDELMKELEHPDLWPENVKDGVALLSLMIGSGKMEVKVAFRIDSRTNEPVTADSIEDGYVHEKWFVMEDIDGNRIYGSGSLNESKTALVLNAENIDVNCDWEGGNDRKRTDRADRDFEDLWENKNSHMLVTDIPDAVRKRLIQLKDISNRPREIDGTIYTQDLKPSPTDILRFSVLKDAPKMPGGIYIGMYSAPVQPWPHQEIVSRRLVESWPYSYMMCDEVGLGKTIEAALAMRSLILSGRAKRVLIVAPKSLTEQWQRELASKTLLPFSRTRVKPGPAGLVEHIRLLPKEISITDTDLYSQDLNIISSGLVSRKERREMLKQSGNCDVVLVDEAHYARRANPRDNSASMPKYGNLYRTLNDVVTGKTESLWLATATPMQIDPIEVYDLFRLAGRSGPYLDDPTLAMRYFELMGLAARGVSLTQEQWCFLGKSYLQIKEIDPYLWKTLEGSVVTAKNRKVLSALDRNRPKRADEKYLKQPLFSASPLSRVMMRHSRKLLELYRQTGELTSNLAKRHVRPVCAVPFTHAEKIFYDSLEDYCNGLEEQVRKNNQAKTVMRFLLNFIQLRFASSLYAIQQTLARRKRRVEQTLLLGGRQFDTEEELQDALDELMDDDVGDGFSEGDLSDITLDVLLKDRTEDDLKWERDRLSSMLDSLESMTETPSKINRLLEEIDRRKTGNRVRQTVVFTRFYDSLFSIRKYLAARAPDLRVGVFSGSHASWYDAKEARDRNTTHEAIKDLFLQEEIDVLLCTDAAAEGLNLQTADLLINFDMGWNPMKIEQRIGRIDRIGQKHDRIEVMNMCYLGSTEEIVYGRLFDRLREAGFVVGTQQISLLPVTADEFSRLQSHEITIEDVERNAQERLEIQKQATDSMEMSAEEMYDMYHRLNASMRKVSLPASVDDIRDAFASSDWLKESGMEVSGTDFEFQDSDRFRQFRVTSDREQVSDECSFLTWGNQKVNEIFEDAFTPVLDAKWIERISVEHHGISFVGYAVAAQDGVHLVTSYKKAKELVPDTKHILEPQEIDVCRQKLLSLSEAETQNLQNRKTAQSLNLEVARAHIALINECTAGVLKERLNKGDIRFKDALRSIENDPKAIFHVSISRDTAGKAGVLLFPVENAALAPAVTVRGILLDCVTDCLRRYMGSLKKNKEKKEITTFEVMNRFGKLSGRN